MQENSHSNPLEFTLGDHDRILKCAAGVEQILEKLTAFDRRLDAMEASFKARMESVESRVKEVEDWKIKAMAIVGLIAFAIGIVARGSLGSLFGKTS